MGRTNDLIVSIAEFGVDVACAAIDTWKAIPVLCNECGAPIPPGSVGKSVSSLWCPNCREVSRLPIFKIPDWVAGVIFILSVNLLRVSLFMP